MTRVHCYSLLKQYADEALAVMTERRTSVMAARRIPLSPLQRSGYCKWRNPHSLTDCVNPVCVPSDVHNEEQLFP